MSKAIKLKDNTYIDASGILYNRELLSNMHLTKFRLVYENLNGGRDIDIRAHGYGIYLLQMENLDDYGASGIYVYRSSTDPYQNIGFTYVPFNAPGTVTRVSCNYQYPNLLQAYRTDGYWTKFIRVIKLIDL